MRFRKRLNPNASTDLIPMIDVVFQLVVFFLMSSTFVVAPGITLNLPQSTTTENVQTDAITIFILEDGRLFLGDEELTFKELSDFFSSGEISENAQVTIEGEMGTDYQYIVTILDILRKNGIRGAALRAETVNE